MKNDECIKEEVLEFIMSSELPGMVSGVVKRDRRPEGSGEEDVIISILANENGQVQSATVNVNIYVSMVDAGPQKDPDHERLKELAEYSQGLFDVFWGTDYRARLLSQRITHKEDVSVITNKIEYKQSNE